MATYNQFLPSSLIANVPDYFLNYGFGDLKKGKKQNLESLVQTRHGCFSSYGTNWNSYLLKEAAGEKNIAFNLLLVIPTVFVSSLDEWFRRNFINISVEINILKEVYQAVNARTFCNYSLDELKIELENKKDNELIYPVLAKLWEETLLEKQRSESLLEIKIKGSKEFTTNSLYYIYYLIGVIIRAFSSPERGLDSLLKFNKNGGISDILDIIQSSFGNYKHWTICEYDYPIQILYLLDNPIIMNDATRGIRRSSYDRPQQTPICDLLFIEFAKLEK